MASAVEGCLDTFEDGVSGISFAPKDAESLEKAAEAFLALPYEKKEGDGTEGPGIRGKNALTETWS